MDIQKGTACFLLTVMLAAPVFASPAPNKSPVEITANDLVVDQNAATATFTGNVEAVQEKYTLKSQKMVVHYKQGAETPQESNKISRIEVFGNVQLSSPDEKATGDSGVYDVPANVVHLNGKVALTKDNNMVQGSNLVYNLKTGKSTLTGGSSASEGEEKQGDGTRVKGVFVPND